jgi:NPCBM/NEW2 domain
MKKRFAQQLKSRQIAPCMTSFVLALALVACNTTPTPTLNQDAQYLKGSKPWSSAVNASSVSSITSGFLSDQTWEKATNGWGPVELDSSNGLDESGDGQQISLSGVKYDKGLGIHSDSSITFKLAGTCSRFAASVGLDDEVRHQGNYGNVIFRVYGDDQKLFDSGGMNRNNATRDIDVNLNGMTSLTLVVDRNQNSTEGDRSNWYDHADWANARVECEQPAPVPTPEPPAPATSLGTGFVSDQFALVTGVTNGWGEPQVDRDNGDIAPETYADKAKLQIAGIVYEKGLGVHAGSKLEFPLGEQCSSFDALIGADDGTKYNLQALGGGTVSFQVLVDGNQKFDSGLVKRGQEASNVQVDLTGGQTLQLIVNDGGDGNAFDHADWVNARVQCGGEPVTPTPVTPFIPTLIKPVTQDGKTIWYLHAPSGSSDTSNLNDANIAWANAAPFDGVALVLQNISWQMFRPGYTLNYNDCLVQAHKADGITKKKAALILTNYPAPPTDTQAWAHVNAQMGLLARCLKEAGWVGLFHDQEPYNNPDGSAITQSDMWNYSWATKETDSAGLSAWAERYAEQARIVSDNFPGMTYGWYHTASAGDGVSPSAYRQSENTLYSLGAAYAGMVNAVSDGSANLNVVDMGEIYDGAGTSFYQGATDYRRNSVQNNLSNLSANARANWANIVQIGFMRMPGYSTTTSALGVTQELEDMWSSLSPNGIASYYDESGFGYAPSFITSGVQSFNNAGRR